VLEHRVLFDERTIAARVEALAVDIQADLPNATPVVIGLLTGSYVFVADLLRATARLGIEPLVDFMAVSHYGGAQQARGEARILKDVSLNVRGRAVLLVDDILDSGTTLLCARDHLSNQRPSWLRSCVLLDKPSRRVVDIHADYVGFVIPDVWVIGYGLDSAGEGRALPYVAAIEPEKEG
jgi:hypoxanthine phosphoribosyltransferase